MSGIPQTLSSPICCPMSTNHVLCWNARGLNSCNVVRNVVTQQRASVVCVQETKIENFSITMNTDITGFGFDYLSLPADGIAGGATISWRRDLWAASMPSVRRFSITLRLSPLNGPGEPWWLTNVYGPTANGERAAFLQELRDVRAAAPGPWLICGDFNMIYRAADKNNGRLHRGVMRRFRDFLDDLELDEVHLSDRLFT